MKTSEFMRLPSFDPGKVFGGVAKSFSDMASKAGNTIKSVFTRSKYNQVDQNEPSNLPRKNFSIEMISSAINRVKTCTSSIFKRVDPLKFGGKLPVDPNDPNIQNTIKKAQSGEASSKPEKKEVPATAEALKGLIEKNTNAHDVRNAIKIILRKEPSLLTLDTTKKLIEDPNYHSTLLNAVRDNPTLLAENYPAISLLTQEDLSDLKVKQVVGELLSDQKIDAKNYLSANIVYSMPETMYDTNEKNTGVEVQSAIASELKKQITTSKKIDLSKITPMMLKNRFVKMALISVLNQNRSNISWNGSKVLLQSTRSPITQKEDESITETWRKDITPKTSQVELLKPIVDIEWIGT